MKKQAFTLVELIVVVTILAILATIGFVSYSGYLTGVRDTNRIASLTSISDGLELYRTKNDLPNPDNAIEIQVESNTIAQQGYVGSNVLQTIEYSKAGKDPKDDSYYSYYLTDDKKHYQLMAFLEESDNLESSLLQNTNAATDYKNRYPKVYGKRLGILTNTDNTPVQEVVTGTLNFTGGTITEYNAFFNDTKSISGTGNTLLGLKDIQSTGGLKNNCKQILQKNPNLKTQDADYLIDNNGIIEKIYCDMTTDGGGWNKIPLVKDNFINGCEVWSNDGYNFKTCWGVTNTATILTRKELTTWDMHLQKGEYIFYHEAQNHDTTQVCSSSIFGSQRIDSTDEGGIDIDLDYTIGSGSTYTPIENNFNISSDGKFDVWVYQDNGVTISATCDDNIYFQNMYLLHRP